MVQQVKGVEAFDKLIKETKGLVAVDFFAVWCRPCQQIGPVFEKIETETPNALFLKVDVDESNDTAGKYGITSMPTFIFFKDGENVKTVIGPTEHELRAVIKELAGSD